ncbi:nucleotidyltransferase family protein [Winogradskyella sediminis]|uniref:nucleotidyltransferase family protein n=1 Tax=Winogradskyella sediminis TaxID=1382466 RepID=UPI000E27C459|nr:nucleotidyltransferase family protein [Winogradskyella sediminis]REG89950.1 putative nucleotidyltransferase-like protein [Winogradskyella sediminis]
MNNSTSTFQHIAHILSFKTTHKQLELMLKAPSFNWEAIVKEASQHYIIPTIYCRLKAKHLLHLLPEDLISYLEYITDENRKRNTVILAQTEELSQLFQLHNIEHVFLKGAALLASGTYTDISERMIGDIDILVKPIHLKRAYKLLLQNEYKSRAMTLGADFFEHKHLPRLETTVTDTRIAAVEIHRKLFVSYKNHELEPESIFNEQRYQESIYLPSLKHLLMHNILNHQINDHGALYNNINFRSAYDTILLLQNYPQPNKLYQYNIIKRYFNYIGLFFEEVGMLMDVKSNIYTHFYLFKLRHRKFQKNWNKLLRIGYYIPILSNRFWLFLSNKSYRKAIMTDKKRVFTHLISILSKK